MSTSSEASLCDENIYNSIYQKQVQKLRNFVYYKCGDLELAQDIAQESFVKLWLNCATVILESVMGYLYTIANRMFIDQTRSQKVRLKFEKEPMPTSNTEDPYYVLRTEEFRETIEQTISDLPEGQREVFLLNRIENYTYKEIAEMLQISSTAVEKRMTKALTKLRGRIAEFKSHKI
ncbi:MAG: RNA polymerase sigma factor [Roseivirga sp.]|nr:RNA polymerase sigma factor [Roseivirga sp.]